MLCTVVWCINLESFLETYEYIIVLVNTNVTFTRMFSRYLSLIVLRGDIPLTYFPVAYRAYTGRQTVLVITCSFTPMVVKILSSLDPNFKVY